MHVGELIVAFLQRHRAHVAHFGSDDHHRSRGSSEVHRVDHDEPVRSIEEALHEVDPTYAHVDHLDLIRQWLRAKSLRDGDAEAVVAPQHVTHPRDKHLHAT